MFKNMFKKVLNFNFSYFCANLGVVRRWALLAYFIVCLVIIYIFHRKIEFKPPQPPCTHVTPMH